MLMVLLPLAMALMFALGVLIDPGRTLGAVYIGSRDWSERTTIVNAIVLSFCCLGLYLIVFGWTYRSVAEFLWRTFALGPFLCVIVAVSVNWMRREAGRLMGE